MVNIIVTINPGANINNIRALMIDVGAFVIRINPNLFNIYANATKEQILQINNIVGVRRIYYDEPAEIAW